MRTAKRGTYYYYVNKYSGVSNIKESQGEVKVSAAHHGDCGQPRAVGSATATAIQCARSTAHSVSHSLQRVRRASAHRDGFCICMCGWAVMCLPGHSLVYSTPQILRRQCCPETVLCDEQVLHKRPDGSMSIHTFVSRLGAPARTPRTICTGGTRRRVHSAQKQPRYFNRIKTLKPRTTGVDVNLVPNAADCMGEARRWDCTRHDVCCNQHAVRCMDTLQPRCR